MILLNDDDLIIWWRRRKPSIGLLELILIEEGWLLVVIVHLYERN
jgi:hypothetical protein